MVHFTLRGEREMGGSWEGSRVMHRVTEAHVSDAAEALVRGAPAMD